MFVATHSHRLRSKLHFAKQVDDKKIVRNTAKINTIFFNSIASFPNKSLLTVLYHILHIVSKIKEEMKRRNIMKRILLITTALFLICSTVFAYIGNRNTRKFHEDYCDSVRAMAAHNKVYIETREEAIERGFVPCKRCRP